MTDARLTDGTPGQRGRSLTRSVSEVVVIVLIVGATWFLFAEQKGEWWLPFQTLAFLTAGLAVIFGASMSAVRGIGASLAVAAAAIGGMVLGFDAGGHFDDPWTRYGVTILTVGTLIVVPLAWLGGAVIGSVWRWMRRRSVTR